MAILRDYLIGAMNEFLAGGHYDARLSLHGVLTREYITELLSEFDQGNLSFDDVLSATRVV